MGLPRTHRIVMIIAGVLTMAAGCAGRIEPIDPGTLTPPAITLPLRDGSARFAVIGDSGTGGVAQHRVAARLISAHSVFPFQFVIMTGDNMYGSEGASDYRNKFEIPYGPLLEAGVKFHASLGNHDDTNQIFYEPFNMDGKQFYTFKPKDDVRLFALDTNYLTPEQLEWLDTELGKSGSRWKMAFFHHPLYSEGRHGSNIRARQALESLFVKHGMDVVFVGHEHFYERLTPQKGVHYFTTGAAAKLRPGDIDRDSPLHAAGFDTGYHFMLVEIAGDELHFQVISDTGRTVDSGVIRQPPGPDSTSRVG